jgi:uncharacterized membrane protein
MATRPTPVSASRPGDTPATRIARRSGFVLGIGIVGALDEILFHQLLQWHHFWDHGTLTAGIVSDGLFHLFTLSMLVAGAIMLWRNRRSLADEPTARGWTAGILLGMGAFQLWDGTINHKVLRLHEIRPGHSPWPYDAGWIAISLLLLALGWWVWRGPAAPDRA